jgi:integrase/recombinase XerD
MRTAGRNTMGAGRQAGGRPSAAAAADARTVNRELSALRGAVTWWQDQDWIRADPTAGLRHLARPAPAQPPVSREQAGLLFRRAACLRDHALWRVLYDSGAPAGTPRAGRCPVTGRGRLSYRRAAEILTEATRPLDAAGAGWTLHQLRGRPAGDGDRGGKDDG